MAGEGERVAMNAMALTAGLIAASPLQSTIQQLCQPKPVDNTDALIGHAVNARTQEANAVIRRQNARIETLQKALQKTQQQAVESLTARERYIEELEMENRILQQMNEQLAARVSARKGDDMTSEMGGNSLRA